SSMLRAFILSFTVDGWTVILLGNVMSKNERKPRMKVAALYDIHGNLPALKAVLNEVDHEGVDVIVIGGDIVPGPMSRDVLEILLRLDDRVRWIRGNCEREVVEAFDGGSFSSITSKEVRAATMWTAMQFERRHRDFMAALPEKIALHVEGQGEVLFCHGSPRSDMEILTEATPEERLRDTLEGVNEDVVVCGHTHMQFDRMCSGKRVVNAGSVGMPYGDPGAYWLLLGPDVRLRKTNYDLEGAAELVRTTEYPLAQDFADNNILKPETAQEAIKYFEKMSTKD
ncbi:MAG TPA: metallophosphoesterase family protein, partial [Ktedonobacteraceae bacterium]|nr:metallophosphoesterase family protein [Ktedonobacteraceae bacterium]